MMRTLIVRCLYSACIALFGMGLTTAASAAAPSEGGKSLPPGSFQIAQPERVCCDLGRHDIFTTRRECRREGGRIVERRQCRRGRDEDRRGRGDGWGRGDGRVCCARRGSDWWARSEDRCIRSGGHVVRGRRCRDDRGSDRICCKRGRADWWTTERRCRRSGGRIARPFHCRNDRRGDRVCCKRGRADWWTTAHRCRRSGGRIARPFHCRDDRRGARRTVCCYRRTSGGYRQFRWMPRRACARWGIRPVARRYCR